MKCMRVIERGAARGDVHQGCPNEAIDERLVQVNNIPYLMLLCEFHISELDRRAGEARARRRARTAELAAQHEASRGRRRG